MVGVLVMVLGLAIFGYVMAAIWTSEPDDWD
jgi:hypothetical protein